MPKQQTNKRLSRRQQMRNNTIQTHDTTNLHNKTDSTTRICLKKTSCSNQNSRISNPIRQNNKNRKTKPHRIFCNDSRSSPDHNHPGYCHSKKNHWQTTTTQILSEISLPRVKDLEQTLNNTEETRKKIKSRRRKKTY